jgi:hypothetical protein
MSKLYYLLITSNNECERYDYELDLVQKLNDVDCNDPLINSLINYGLIMISSSGISDDFVVKRSEYWINKDHEDKLQIFDRLWIESGFGIQAISGALFCLTNTSPFILNDIFQCMKSLKYAPLIGYKPNGNMRIMSDSNELYVETLSLTLILDEDNKENDGENEEDIKNIARYELKPIRELIAGTGTKKLKRV